MPPKSVERRSTRTTRQTPDAVLAPVRDDIDRIGRRRRNGEQASTRSRGASQATRGRGRGGRGPRPAQRQTPAPPDEDNTSDCADPAGSNADADEAEVPPPPAGQPSGGKTEGPDQPPAPEQGAGTNDSHQTGGDQSNQVANKDAPSKDSGKRGASGGGHEPGDPKRAKTGDEGGTDQQQRQSGDPTQGQSCALLRERLAQWSLVPISADTVIHGQMMEDVDVYRAIGAVSEAVTALDSHQYSLLDPIAVQAFADPLSAGSNNVAARPRQEVLFPWARNGHISLFVVERDSTRSSNDGVDHFRMVHYDSSYSRRHRGSSSPSEAARQTLMNAGWARDRPNTNEAVLADRPNVENSALQQFGWTCGLHTIFSAWAVALGLQLSGGIERYQDFIRDGIEVVRRAVRGQVEAQIIWAFFDCHRFIQTDQVVPITRAFDHTFAFQTRDVLPTRVARIRIEEDLQTLRARGDVPDEFPTFDLALEMLDNPDLTRMTVQDFVTGFNEVQRALASGPGTQQDGPQRQHSDRTQTAIDRSRAEADAEEARLLQHAIEQSLNDTGPETGQADATAGQGVDGGGQNGQTGTRQTSQDIRDDEAAARRAQAELDAGSDRVTPRRARNPMQHSGNAQQANGEQDSGTAGNNGLGGACGGRPDDGKAPTPSPPSSPPPPPPPPPPAPSPPPAPPARPRLPETTELAQAWATGTYAHLFPGQPDIQQYYSNPDLGNIDPEHRLTQQEQTGTGEDEQQRQQREEHERNSQRARDAVAAAQASANTSQNQPPPYDPSLDVISPPYDPAAPQMPGTQLASSQQPGDPPRSPVRDESNEDVDSLFGEGSDGYDGVDF